MVILSSVLHASWNVIAKQYSGNYSLIYLSFCIGFVLCFPFAYPHFALISNWKTILPLIICTGLMHAIYGFLLSYTYHNGDISTLYPIVRGSGIVGSVFFGIVLLGEKLPTLALLGIVTVVMGIALLSYKRDREATPLRGILLALLSGAFIMTYTILDKLIVDRVHPLVLMASSQLISATVFLPYVILKRKDEFKHTIRFLWRPVLSVAVLALASYLIILYAFQIAPLSRIVAIRELSVVFGAIAGYAFLKEDFSRTRLAGVIIVVLGIVLVKQF